MEKVNINIKTDLQLRDELKSLAKEKGMRFHSYIEMEFQKIVKRSKGKK